MVKGKKCYSRRGRQRAIKRSVNTTSIMIVMMLLSSGITFSMSIMGTLFFKDKINHSYSTLQEQGIKEYKSYYALVVEDTKDLFWENVYKAAKEEGIKQDIYIELIGNDLLEPCTVEDKFHIALNSGVDGIMIAPEGQDIEELLKEAEKEKIPVVTLLDDNMKGERKSFIGINSEDIARLYVDTIEAMNREVENILILMDAKEQTTSKNFIYSSINEALSKAGFTVEIKPINRENTFAAEEIIRDIILNDRKIPDILICLNVEDTLCAYQAVIDYNKVGKMILMGYYQSEVLLQGIAKGIIDTTLWIDTAQIGRQGVEALQSYLTHQQVNAYFTVQATMVNKQNITKFRQSNEKGS